MSHLGSSGSDNRREGIADERWKGIALMRKVKTQSFEFGGILDLSGV